MDVLLAGDLAYQEAILQGVSRTFALTIPLLPKRLCIVVGNAYLLCRIADTIEDADTLRVEEKHVFSQRFVRVVEGQESAEAFGQDLAPRLQGTTLPEERDLVFNTPKAVRLTHSFTEAEQASMARCVRIMSEGMETYQEGRYTHGLPDMAHMDQYCYYVAGVVGEMLTDLFCAHSPAIAARREQLYPLSINFGQGLQMTNILKDIWDDKARGACWLPQKECREHGLDLLHLSADTLHPEGFPAALDYLVSTARMHLEQALNYTLLIPRSEAGIRHFCFLPVDLAIKTLGNIHRHRLFSAGKEVKITRRNVKATVACTKMFGRSNVLLHRVFAWNSRCLP